MRLVAVVLPILLVSLSAHAQRGAVSADLSPEAAGEAFQQAVVETCVPAVTGSGVSGVSAAQRGRLQPTNDVETRRQAGAAPDETVWDVMDGKGVVTVREKAGRCVVSVYGPPAGATVQKVAQALTGAAGFQRLASPASGVGQTLQAASNGRSVMVQLAGSDPGMVGHQSRFSVVTATVFVAQ